MKKSRIPKPPAPPAAPAGLPMRPPMDLAEAVLIGAASEITPEVEADYVAAVYRQPGKKVAKAAAAKQCRAVLMMATVGFSFVNWQKKRTT